MRPDMDDSRAMEKRPRDDDEHGKKSCVSSNRLDGRGYGEGGLAATLLDSNTSSVSDQFKRLKQEADVGVIVEESDGDHRSQDAESLETTEPNAASVVNKSPQTLQSQTSPHVLKHVREELELFKAFEGAISQEEITQHKRQLFAVLSNASAASSNTP